MNPSRYLERVGLDEPFSQRAGHRVATDVETLWRLHRQHLMTVPFENLDIHLKRRMTLDAPALYEKIVEHRRGGFCYELNGAFAWLLRELGFDVSLLSARVIGKDGRASPDFDHLALLVRLGERWLADVGFGDNFLDPVKLDSEVPHSDGLATYRVVQRETSTFTLERQSAEKSWVPQYVFTTQSREMADFDARCTYHQTSPDSHFARERLCTLARAEGRITLAGLTLIQTVGGRRTETRLAGEEEWRRALVNLFGVKL